MMPDISMCATKNCPLAKDCYRSTESGTEPCERQSWVEFEFFIDATGAHCSDFYPIYILKSRDTDSLC